MYSALQIKYIIIIITLLLSYGSGSTKPTGMKSLNNVHNIYIYLENFLLNCIFHETEDIQQQ